MVVKGQFLERATLIPVGELVLDGVAHRGQKRPAVLVLPPPAFEGGGMDHVVGAEVAYAVSRAGHSTVRFNYRGVGGSQGKVSRKVEDWLLDAGEALKLAADNAGGGPVVLVAIGASDAVALRLAQTLPGAVAGIALVNPTVLQPSELSLAGDMEWEIIFPEHQPVDRLAWSNALTALGRGLTLIPGADRSYQRNLPLVGQAVVHLLQRVSGSLSAAPTH
jgi:alpha/beta superfamily hydrolase